MEQKKQSKEQFKGIQPDMAPVQQIQQHEWVPLGQWIYKCIHCGSLKDTFVPGRTEYKCFTRNKRDSTEPACITRPINAPQRNADK